MIGDALTKVSISISISVAVRVAIPLPLVGRLPCPRAQARIRRSDSPFRVARGRLHRGRARPTRREQAQAAERRTEDNVSMSQAKAQQRASVTRGSAQGRQIQDNEAPWSQINIAADRLISSRATYLKLDTVLSGGESGAPHPDSFR